MLEFFKKKAAVAKATQEAKPEPAFEFLQRMGRKHQFQVEVIGDEEDEDWVVCSFEYQGGQFICYCGKQTDELLLRYCGFADVPYSPANYEKVRHLCFTVTRDRKYAKCVYTYDTEDNTLNLHLLVESIGPSEVAFLYYLTLCFRVANEVRPALSSDPDSGTEEEQIASSRERYLQIQAEMKAEEEHYADRVNPTKAPNHGTIGEYIAYLFEEEKVEDLLRMTVVSASGVEKETQRDRIASQSMLELMISETGGMAHYRGGEPVVVTVESVSNHYVFTLHPLRQEKDFLPVRMTAVCTPHEYMQDYVPDAVYEPKAVSMLLCYYKTELPEVGDEDDAELPQTQPAEQIRQGHALLMQENYLQAIAVLTPIFRSLHMRYLSHKNSERVMFYQTAYYIGCCYMRLHLYEKAFYYLDFVKNIGRRDYMREYIRFYVETFDICTTEVIESEIARTQNLLADNEADEDCGTEAMVLEHIELQEHMAFLLRCNAHVLVHQGFYDRAIEIYKALLDYEPYHDFAERKLKETEDKKNECA